MLKPIKDYEGLYSVDENGMVFSHYSNKFLIPVRMKNDYYYVHLCKNSKAKKHYIHRLVATAFIDHEPNCTEVNHINGNKSINCVSNLEWVTPKENCLHAYRTGLSKNKRQKLCKEQIEKIINLFKTGCYTKKALGKMFGVTDVTIGNVLKGKFYKTILNLKGIQDNAPS